MRYKVAAEKGKLRLGPGMTKENYTFEAGIREEEYPGARDMVLVGWRVKRVPWLRAQDTWRSSSKRPALPWA
jgi:hypothetical protein